MKQFPLVLFVLCTSFQVLYAQKSAVKFSIGYGFPLASEYITQKSDGSYNVTLNQFGNFNYAGSETVEGVYGSYGSGLQFTGAFQRMLTKNIGVELAFQYLSGEKYSGKQQVFYYYQGATYPYTYQKKFQGHVALAMPSIILTTGEGTLRPYMLAGLCIGKAILNTSSMEDDGEEIIRVKTKYSGNIPVGLRGGIGINYVFSQRINFFSEANLMSMSYYPKEQEVTAYSVDGTSKLSDLKENQKKTVYSKQITYNSTDNTSGQPNRSLRQSLLFSNWSLSAGIKITFGSSEND